MAAPARVPVWTDRLLGLCPTAIAVLWMAGFASMHGRRLEPVEWLVLVAGAFAVRIVSRRVMPPRPLPKLPEGVRAVRFSAVIASLTFVVACVVGGVLELLLQQAAQFESDVPWGLRMLWHGGCAFGASYCAWLRRLLPVLPA